MIVVLIPSHFEAGVFLKEIAGPQRSHVGGADVTVGKIGETAVALGIIGMGLPHAKLRARAVMEELKRGAGSGEKETNPKHETIRGVILAGFAGGLNPALKRGEIFITAGAEFLLPHLPEAERPRVAKLATVNDIAGPAAKKELFERDGAWLCDMEQSHVAAVAQECGLPFIGVRIVSDAVDEDLPVETLSHYYDQATGTYTPWKFAGHLIRNPLRIGPLVAFVRPLSPIRNRMSDCLHTWLRQTGPRLFGR
jgi:uridine phosphorylase